MPLDTLSMGQMHHTILPSLWQSVTTLLTMVRDILMKRTDEKTVNNTQNEPA